VKSPSRVVFTLVTLVMFVAVAALANLTANARQAPAGAGPGRATAPAPDPTKPQVLTIAAGTKARYRVNEQLAGISFPSDAVGTTEAVSGSLVVNPDGTFGAASKFTVDLKTIKSDQSMRDGYVQNNTLETAKYPTLDLVPKSAKGLPVPFPSGMGAQAGFQLVTAMTLHGVTKEITWNVVATFTNASVSGRATTTFDFATFNITKPSLARLLSVDDKIHLEIEFQMTRQAQ
jgi:polyisoprenoid-binding protein YceI